MPPREEAAAAARMLLPASCGGNSSAAQFILAAVPDQAMTQQVGDSDVYFAGWGGYPEGRPTMYRYASAAAEDHAREPVFRACAHARPHDMAGSDMPSVKPYQCIKQDQFNCSNRHIMRAALPMIAPRMPQAQLHDTSVDVSAP